MPMKRKDNLLVEWDLDFIVESSEEVILNENEEGEGDKKETIFSKLTGVFQKGNAPNGNKRIYKTELLTREVERFQSKITQGLAMGKVYHPGFFDPGGPAGVNDVSHRVTKLWMDGDIVKGELLIFKTVSGKDVEAINDGGGRIGISSRGYGGMERYNKFKIGGNEYKDVWVVSDNYRLETFDLVLTPSVKTAIMRPVKNEGLNTDENNNCNEEISEGGRKSMTIEELKAKYPEVYNLVHDAAVKEGRDLGASDERTKIVDAHRVAVEAKDTEISKLKVDNSALTTENADLKKKNEEIKIENDKIAAEKLKGDIKAVIADAVSKSDYKDYFKEEDIEHIATISDSADSAGKEIKAREKVYENAIATFKAASVIDTKSKNTDTSEGGSGNVDGAGEGDKDVQKVYAESQRMLAFG